MSCVLWPHLRCENTSNGAIPAQSPVVQVTSRAHSTGAILAGAQAAVYLVRSSKGVLRRLRAKSVHAPARRLARTTISLGPEEGIIFGLRAIRYRFALTICREGNS